MEQTGQLLLSDQPICSSLRFSELWTFFTASEAAQLPDTKPGQLPFTVWAKRHDFFYDSDKGDAHNRIFLGVNCYCYNIFITTLLQVICLYKGS